MKFEWDEDKNESNIQKHGLDFADAEDIFQSFMLVALDTRFDYDEDRYVGIGLLRNNVVVVVYTELEDDVIRIISLRKAVKRERLKYEKAFKN